MTWHYFTSYSLLFTYEDITEVLGLSIQELAVYFYADDGLIVLTQPERL